MSEEASAPGRFARLRGPYGVAALFVAPFFILMLTWAGSNPPGAAPDERDHLVKALGVAHLDIGRPYTTPVPESASMLTKRNASISRVVPIPARLSTEGYKCTAHRPTETAACLPKKAPTGTGTINVATPMGSYPPFVYLPMGLAAEVMNTPARAFYAARFASVVMSSLLLFLGAAHLVRWLGRRALLGSFVALTPMALFSSAVVSNSGVEICGAFGLAAVAVAAIRRSESLSVPATYGTLTVVGGALILSRQLGVVTFAAVLALVAVRVGWRTVWELVRRHRPAFVGSAAFLAVAVVAILVWERRYDHPSNTAGPFSAGAVMGFARVGFLFVREGIGLFGWLDTPEPRWVILSWILLAVVLIGMAIVLGSRADRWSLVAWLIGLVLVAYVVYATVFYPIGYNLQGRHMLPFFMLGPILAGVVLSEVLERFEPDALARMFNLVAVVIPVIQLTSLYVNARRYAVGTNGPYLFFGSAQWSPKGGWGIWLVLGLLGALSLGALVVMCKGSDERSLEGMTTRVEG